MTDQLNVGHSLTLESGRVVRIEEELSGGLQGTAYAVRTSDDDKLGVLKVFSAGHGTTETVERNRTLAHLGIHRWYRALAAAPFDVLNEEGLVGHFARRVPGRDLRSYLRDGWGSTIQNLLLAAASARAVEALHARGMSHGDIGARNLLISGGREGETLALHLIDFDNFAIEGKEGPTGTSPATGLGEYQPPERLTAYVEGRSAGAVTLEQERYSLAVVIHELVTRRHPLQGRDSSAPEMLNAQLNAGWLHDPQNPNRVDLLFGLPGEGLDDALQDPFRRVFAPETALEDRPTAKEWVRALIEAVGHVAICPIPSCRRTFIPAPDDASCPFCNSVFPTLGLKTPTGEVVLFDAARRSFGRQDANGRQTVSRRHVDFERWGPIVLMVPQGSNATRRKVGDRWVKLDNDTPYDIAPGDRLLLADYEVEIIQHGSPVATGFPHHRSVL